MGIDELSIFTDMTLSNSLISLTRGEGLIPQQTLSIEGLLGDILTRFQFLIVLLRRIGAWIPSLFRHLALFYPSHTEQGDWRKLDIFFFYT